MTNPSPFPPKLISSKPGSSGWKNWSHGKDLDGFPRILDSMVNSISGEDPFRTCHMLWRELTGKSTMAEPSAAIAAVLLQEIESARKAYVSETGERMATVTVEHPENPWAGASLHGLSILGDTLMKVHFPDERTTQLIKDKKVPKQDWVEIQWQLLCCPTASRAHFWSYDGTTGICLTVTPNREFQGKLLAQARVFRDFVVTNSQPPGNAWRDCAERWLKLRNQKDLIEMQMDAIEAELIELMPKAIDKVEANGIAVLRYQQNGKTPAQTRYRFTRSK